MTRAQKWALYVKQKIAFAYDLVSVVLMHYLPFIIVLLICNNGTDAFKLQMVPKNPQCWYIVLW